jgi:hypothetical protein
MGRYPCLVALASRLVLLTTMEDAHNAFSVPPADFIWEDHGEESDVGELSVDASIPKRQNSPYCAPRRPTRKKKSVRDRPQDWRKWQLQMQDKLVGKVTYHFFIPRQEYPLTNTGRNKKSCINQHGNMRRYSGLRQTTARMDCV